jgi:HlyD family secretion protein
MKRWLIVLVVVAAAGAAIAGALLRHGDTAPSYRFVTVERGRIDSVVSATGSLSAVTTVKVGTQVSGLIAKLYVDFNDTVTKGQVIAQIDTTLLESNLRDAEASLERSQAELRQAERELERFTSLNQQGIAPLADLNNAQYGFEVAHAQLKSADASLARARQNLAYATITAPVSGTVVERAVDVGQTVAASLQAPELFTIANDLSQMQILASVDESDIGSIGEGQPVRFTVKTYPERTFSGTVKQVRLQSTVDQNIVNYTVVIAVANPDRTLLPGMTATVEFVVASADDVLKVANAALRFRPPDALATVARERMQAEWAARREAGGGGPHAPAGERAGEGGRGGASDSGHARMPGGPGGAPERSQMTMLYYLEEDGTLSAMPVRPGITDGQSTEIRGRNLAEDMQVIAGMVREGQTSSSNPFMPSSSGGPRRPPGMF